MQGIVLHELVQLWAAITTMQSLHVYITAMNCLDNEHQFAFDEVQIIGQVQSKASFSSRPFILSKLDKHSYNIWPELYPITMY